MLGAVIEMSVISERLLQAIRQRGYSYVTLSERSGVPKSAIQRYATGGTSKIPSERIDALATALGVSANWLMGWEDKAPDEDELQQLLDELRGREDMRMLFRLAKDTSPEDVRRAVRIIEALRRED